MKKFDMIVGPIGFRFKILPSHRYEIELSSDELWRASFHLSNEDPPKEIRMAFRFHFDNGWMCSAVYADGSPAPDGLAKKLSYIGTLYLNQLTSPQIAAVLSECVWHSMATEIHA